MPKYYHPNHFDQNAAPRCPECSSASALDSLVQQQRDGYAGQWIVPTWKCSDPECSNHVGWQETE